MLLHVKHVGLALLVTEQEMGVGKHQMLFALCQYTTLISDVINLSYTAMHDA